MASFLTKHAASRLCNTSKHFLRSSSPFNSGRLSPFFSSLYLPCPASVSNTNFALSSTTSYEPKLFLRTLSTSTDDPKQEDEQLLSPTKEELSDDGGSIISAAGIKISDFDFSGMSNSQLADPSTIPGWELISTPPRKNPRGALVGTVVSDKMQKTVNVAVDRYRIVPKYRKRKKYTRKFMAHDENEVCNMGDLVMIVPCQKISRHKHFMVREIIRAKGQLS